jgi:peptide/nickel transport system substrate-binding protein
LNLIKDQTIFSTLKKENKKMSSVSRRDFLRVSTTVAAGALLAACGQAATEAPAATTAPETKPEEKATEAPKAPARPTDWPLGDVPRSRTWIRAGGNGSVELCSPWVSGWNHQNGFSLIYEPMAFYGIHADKQYLWLAESYKYNDTATELTITLRKGIEWSDGTPFTAKDVAYTIETQKRIEGLNNTGQIKKVVDSVVVVDDYNVTLKLNQADWRMFFSVYNFRFDRGDDGIILPQHVFSTIADDKMIEFRSFDVAKGWPVTTGAFGVSKSEEQYNQFDLRPSWWAVKSGFVTKEPDVWRVLNVPFSSDTLAAQQVINDEVDCSLDMRPLTIASLLVQTDHVSTWTGKKPPFGYVDWWPISVNFCCQKPPFDNPKVRWAVAHAIDRQQLVDVAWGGAGKLSYSPFPEYPRLNKYVDGIKDIMEKYGIFEKNLDKTAALMTEAGFTKDAEGFWADKDGNRPDSDIYAGVPLFSDLAPVIAEQLRTAGFASEHKAPPDVWAAKVDGRASMFLFGHGGGVIDPYDTMLLYKSSDAAKMGEQSWGNITRWSDPKFEELRDQMLNTSMDDEAKMTELFRAMMDIWYAQLPDCPIVQWFHRIPQNETYWDNWPTETNNYMNSAPWHLTQFYVVQGLKAKKI